MLWFLADQCLTFRFVYLRNTLVFFQLSNEDYVTGDIIILKDSSYLPWKTIYRKLPIGQYIYIPEEGGVLPYVSYALPHRVAFLRRFGLQTGIHFAHFGLE